MVYIAALDPDCPAALALRCEGIEHEVVVLEDDYAYGRLLTRLWHLGQGFTLLEHDVVPWPGALDLLAKCPELWCGHNYPFAPNTIRGALGCVKFSTEFIQAHPDLPEVNNWSETFWAQLDGRVCAPVANILGSRTHHLHEPAFAHARP